ncbi:MAG: DUF2842 domain-containing protein [Devosia sp.]|nr:DUF2842 domain-containing protein [Devosia sp.]
MTQSTRKLIGTVLILLVLVVYAWIAMEFYARFLTGLPQLGQLAYFVIAGLLWALPAGAIIRWMVRPDKTV